MNLRWILLAFFLVAVILGTVKALKRDMLKNLLRLGSVVIAFLITFFLQLGGIFEGIVIKAAGVMDLAAMLGEYALVEPILVALASTVISTLFFVTVFLVILPVLRLIIHIVLRVVSKKSAKKKQAVIAEVTEAEAKEAQAAEASEAADVQCEAPAENKPKKKKKALFHQEIAWKRAISVASGMISGVLILSVLLMPLFYLMGLASSAIHATDNVDAEDSQIYKVVEVVDAYVVEPYETSFVGGFYDVFGLSDLMIVTARLGGRIELEDHEAAYADDTLKTVLSHGVSAMAQVTSAKSECKTVREDIKAIIADPALSSVLADLVTELLHDIEFEESAEDDLVGGLVNNFLRFYKEADKATVQHELEVLGDTVGVLAEERLLARVLSGSADFGNLMGQHDTLANIVEAISGLSAFGPTLENAFKLGVMMMDDTLQIPADDAEAYENFIEDLLNQMQKEDSTSFDINTIRYYIVKCQQKGVKVSASNGIKGHSQFVAYVAHWEKVQSAFAHAAEDTSYGYFTIEINGQWYVYDKNEKKILIYDSETEEKYKDKISPVAGIINALTLRSTQNRLTANNLYTILNAYVTSATDAQSVALANRMLQKDTFVSRAVTTEKMLAATNFSDWTDEEKAKDSKICVDIVLEIMTLIDHLSTLETLNGVEEAADMLNEFTLLGDIMDNMKETSCINSLPPLLLEGVVKNEAFNAFIRPSVAFQINNIVENNNKTYADCMKQIAGVLSWAVNSFGNSLGG